jgi:hypothetical protein
MIKTVSRMILAVAAGSLAFAPIAAQAGTRASDSAAFYSSAASLAADDDDGGYDEGGLFRNPGAIFLSLIAGGLIITGIVFAAQTDSDGQSPGT